MMDFSIFIHSCFHFLHCCCFTSCSAHLEDLDLKSVDQSGERERPLLAEQCLCLRLCC